MPLRADMGLGDFGHLFFRWKWLIIFSFLFILLGGAVYCVVTPELYKSSTTLLIIPQSVPQDNARSVITVGFEQQLAAIKQQVLSRNTLGKVMDGLNLFEKERQKLSAEEVAELMRKRIMIAVDHGKGRDTSDAFTLSFLHENKQLAMHAAARLAAICVEENLNPREPPAAGISESLDSQLKDSKEKLEALETKVKEYKIQFAGKHSEQKEANFRMLAGLRDRLRSNEAAARTQRDRKVSLEAQLQLMEKSVAVPAAESASRGAPPPEDPAQSLPGQLALKKARLTELSMKYTPRNPTILALKREIGALEQRIAEDQRAVSSPTDGNPKSNPRAAASPPSFPTEEINRMKAQLHTATVEVASLQKEKEDLLKRIVAVEDKLQRSPRREPEMVSLLQNYENQKTSYNDLLKKRLEADIAQNLERRREGAQFQILEPANLPETPFQPDRKQAMGIALALALGLGFGGALFLEGMDQRLRDVPDFTHFYKVPILGCITVARDDGYKRAQTVRRLAVLAGLITFTVALFFFLRVYNDKIRDILNF